MVISASANLFMLAVETLHHERIKNADLLQCLHVAMNASECRVETVEEIVDVGFGTTVESGALIESVSAMGYLSSEGDLWSGRAGVQPLALPVFSVIFERRKRAQQNSAAI